MSSYYTNTSSNRSQQNAATSVKKKSSAFKKNSSVGSSLHNFSFTKSSSEKVHFKTNNRDNELEEYNRILDVRKAIDKMNFIYPDSSIASDKLGKRKQKQNNLVNSTSSINNVSRFSKSARDKKDYTELTYSLRPSNSSASKTSFKPSPSNSELQKKQSSINTILCQRCLNLHLDRCSLCFNDPNQDISDNEYYYYTTTIESSGMILFFSV
jgi:hypothetical protein